MKKFLMALSVLGCMLIMSGCAETPQQVAQKWGEAIINGDLAAANNYSSPETHQVNETIIKDMAENAEHRATFEAHLQQVANSEVFIDGDVAQIIIDGKAVLALVKVNGSWKVHINVQKGGSREPSESETEAAAKAQADVNSKRDSE